MVPSGLQNQVHLGCKLVVTPPPLVTWGAASGYDTPEAGVSLQASAQAQAQNMAFQAHNLQAHAQQLEVESAHPVPSHINVGLQHQVDQVHHTCCISLTFAAPPTAFASYCALSFLTFGLIICCRAFSALHLRLPPLMVKGLIMMLSSVCCCSFCPHLLV